MKLGTRYPCLKCGSTYESTREAEECLADCEKWQESLGLAIPMQVDNPKHLYLRTVKHVKTNEAGKPVSETITVSLVDRNETSNGTRFTLNREGVEWLIESLRKKLEEGKRK